MPLGHELKAGALGIRVVRPDSLRVIADEPKNLVCVDDEQAVEWHLFFARSLHMDLGEPRFEHLRRYVEWIARGMFDQVFEQLMTQAKPSPDAANVPDLLRPRRRTEDANWSPVVEASPLELDGVRAFRLIHRMTYVTGREMIMGHLLMPLPGGLFEARVTAMDRQTGIRESVLLATEMQRDPARFSGADPFGGMRQSNYDDLCHDAQFPRHCLSRVRAALGALRETWKLEVRERAPQVTAGEHELSELGCAISPPPRFVREPSRGSEVSHRGVFRRVSFCTTDGIDSLFVERHKSSRPVTAPALALEAESRTRAILAQNGIEQIQLTSEERPAIKGRPQVLVVGEGQGHLGRLRNVFRWFIDERGALWSLAVVGNTVVIPGEAMAAELEAAASTWRSLEVASAPASRRPWWKVW